MQEMTKMSYNNAESEIGYKLLPRPSFLHLPYQPYGKPDNDYILLCSPGHDEKVDKLGAHTRVTIIHLRTRPKSR